MFWWILLGILVLLLILPLGASIFYDAAGIRVLVVAGPIRFTVFPMKKKPPKEEKPKEEPTQEPVPEPASEESAPVEPKPEPPVEAPATEEPKALPTGDVKKPHTPLPEAPKPPKDKDEESNGGSLVDFLPLVDLVLKFLGEFFHKTLHIDVLYLKLTMAGGDPADLAISYGNTWAALGNLWPYIDRMFTIKKRDIQIQCDFEASESLVNARVDITTTLARLLGLLFGYAFRILIKFLQIRSEQKEKAAAAKKQVTNPKNHKAV